MPDKNITLHIEFEGECEDSVEISPQSSILDLKKEVVDIFAGNLKDVKLKIKGEDEEFEDFPEDDEIKLGLFLKDNDVIDVEFPDAGEKAKICTIWNATDDDLKVEVFYKIREVHGKRGFNTVVNPGFNATQISGNLGFEFKIGDKTYILEDKEEVQDISAHKKGTIILHADFNGDRVGIKLTKKETSDSSATIVDAMQANQQKIIYSHKEEYKVEGVKKTIWGTHKNWQPKEGMSKNPHRELAEGNRCIICEENQNKSEEEKTVHQIHKCKICGTEMREKNTTGCF